MAFIGGRKLRAKRRVMLPYEVFKVIGKDIEKIYFLKRKINDREAVVIDSTKENGNVIDSSKLDAFNRIVITKKVIAEIPFVAEDQYIGFEIVNHGDNEIVALGRVGIIGH